MSKFSRKFALAASIAVGVAVAGCSMMHHEKEEEGNEVKVKLTEAPAAVQQAFARESTGARKPIDTLDKETDKSGQVIYEADAVLADGKNYEIRVDANGKVISKKVDNEEDEKGKKNEKEEEDERHEKK